ncbi:MAG: ATP-binding cassette domain-containing protein, partial [Microgenomates group bacterium]
MVGHTEIEEHSPQETSHDGEPGKPPGRFSAIKNRLQSAWQGAISTPDHLLSEADLERMSRLTSQATSVELHELIQKIRRNRRWTGVLRILGLGADNLFLAKINGEQEGDAVMAVLAMAASIIFSVAEYDQRNKSQDTEIGILAAAIFEIINSHADSLATSAIPQQVLSGAHSSIATTLANSERVRGATAIEMYGTMVVTAVNTLLMGRLAEAGVVAGATLAAIPSLKHYYSELKKRNKEHQETTDTMLMMAGSENRIAYFDLIKGGVDKLTKLKNKINRSQLLTAGLLPMASLLLKGKSFLQIDLGFSSILAGIYSKTVSGAIGMQMMAEQGKLALERLRQILDHIETQNLAINDEQSWDAHRKKPKPTESEQEEFEPNTWAIRNFSASIPDPKEESGQREVLTRANLSLPANKVYILRGASGDGKSVIMRAIAQAFNHDEFSEVYKVDQDGVAVDVHDFSWKKLRREVKSYDGADFISPKTLRNLFWEPLFFDEESLAYDFWDIYVLSGNEPTNLGARKNVSDALNLVRGVPTEASPVVITLRDWILGKQQKNAETQSPEFIEAKLLLERAISWKLRALLVDRFQIYSSKEFNDLYDKSIGKSMSTGQRARSQVALLLVERPQLIFVDELFSRLDGEEVNATDSNKKIIAKCLIGLARSRHTIVVSAHMNLQEEKQLFGEAEEFGGTIFLRDKKLVLNNGTKDKVEDAEITPLIFDKLLEIDGEESEYVMEGIRGLSPIINDELELTEANLEKIFKKAVQRKAALQAKFLSGDKEAALRLRLLAHASNYQIGNLLSLGGGFKDPEFLVVKEFIFRNFYKDTVDSIGDAAMVMKDADHRDNLFAS